MIAPILDHLVLDVHDDMDAAVRTYERLGFTLTPRGHHTLGSINHLAVFEQNYLELIGFGTDARAELAAFPRGLNGLVFKTGNAETITQDAAATNLPILPVASFSRPVTIDTETLDASFRTARLDPARTGLGRIYFCEHLTPELVWRNEWLRHRNGAQTIIRLLVAADEVPRLAALFSGLFGTSAVRWDWDGMSMQAGNARIDVRSHAAVAGELGDAAPEPAGRPDYMAAITFRVGALDRTARVLYSMVGARPVDGNLIVPASACGNVALIFTELTTGTSMTSLCLEDFEPGSVHTLGSRTVTQDEILDFARRWDPQPFHVDPEAAEHSIYGGLIASGWHTCAMMMRAMCDGYLLRSAGLGSPGVDELRWLAPVRPGDTLTFTMEVLEVRPSNSKPDRGVVRSRWEATNQDGTRVLSMDGLGMFRRRPGQAAG